MVFKLEKATVRLFALCIFYVIYLLIGAAIFSAIEYDNEKAIITDLKEQRQKFLKDNANCINDVELEAFIARIIEANSRGISAMSNLTVEPNWSFGQAVFFSGTVLTTIGYGHVTPLSNGGKIFCMIYALFGIPITLIMISACVERLLLLTNKIKNFFKTRLCASFNDKCVSFTHLTLVFLFVFIAFFLIPAAIFSALEKEWDYLDALYYCFISLSTIGLGDYIPGDTQVQPYRAVYKIATTVYLILGIMFVMLLLNVIIQVPELNISNLFTLKQIKNDPERQYLGDAVASSPSYTRQIDEDDTTATNNNTETQQINTNK